MIQRNSRLDPVADLYTSATEAVSGSGLGPTLRGDWLGHALHPLLTDFPLGCWSSAALLDVVGGTAGRPFARRLIGAGLVASVPTALAGAAEWPDLVNRSTKRVAAVHASGNVAVVILYFWSWRLRHGGKHAGGVLIGMVAGCLALITGYLGGHLSFAWGIGQGERGQTAPAQQDQPDPSLDR